MKCFILYLFCAFFAAFDLAAAGVKNDNYLILLPLEVQRNGNSRLVSRPSVELEKEFEKAGLKGRIGFCDKTLTAEKLRHYNVVVFGVAGYAFQRAIRGEEANRVAKLLLDYVRDGGGLLIMRNPGYQFDTEIAEINQMIKPTGGQILYEQMFDTDAAKTHLTPGKKRIYWTDQIVPHKVTEGVKGLYYPDLFSPYHRYTDFSTAIKVDDNWQVLAYGSPTARTYYRKKGGVMHDPAKGTYQSRPPFLAVREFGKGRIALMPVASTLYWHDTHHIFWASGAYSDGSENGHPGNGLKLMVNLMKYLAEPTSGSRMEEAPDTWQFYTGAAANEPGFVAINWDDPKSCFAGKHFNLCRTGLIGAQSELSCGRGTPGQFIAEAKKAGYDFIAFAEEFSSMTPEKFAELQKICSRESRNGFYAYPGFSFTDEAGNAWVTFSDKLTWPPKEWLSNKYLGRMSNLNPLSRGWNWPPMILVNSKSNNDRPFFRGNYKIFSAYTFKNGKLTDSSLDEYIRLAQDSFMPGVTTVHFTTSPEYVSIAQKSGYQAKARWFEANVIGAFKGNHCIAQNKYIWNRPLFISQGPEIEDFRIMNFGTSDLAVKGLDRWRMHIRATAPAGIRTIEIFEHEENNIWRKFDCNGQKTVDMQIDGHHDRKRNLIMRVTDCSGKSAISWEAWTGVQENGYSRCSDNLNTMPRGKWWGPPAHQQNTRGFEDFLVTREFNYCGTPFFPELGSEGTLPAMEYRPLMVNRFVSVIECRMQAHWPLGRHANLDSMDSVFPTRPNEYYEAVVRYTVFTGRQDSTLLELIDGKVKIRDNFISRPRIFTNLARMNADHLSWKNPDGKVETMTPVKAPFFAPVAKDGFAAFYPDPFKGSPGVIPLMDNFYLETNPLNQHLMELNGRIGKTVSRFRAGDEFTYRYLAAVDAFAKDPGYSFMTDVTDKLGIDGTPAYEVTADSGKVLDTKYILSLAAENGGFSGKVSKAELPIDLPVMISGLNPRWDALIWYRGENDLLIAKRTFDDRGCDFISRHVSKCRDEVRFFGVLDDTGYCQIDTETGDRDLFIGHPVICDQKEVFISISKCKRNQIEFELHNPTGKSLTCKVENAPGLPDIGIFKAEITLPPGSSRRVSCDASGKVVVR